VELRAGQVAVITGGASGIGLALALACASRGLDVVLADVEEVPLGQAVRQVGEAGTTVLGVPTDVTSPAQVDQLAATTLEQFGRVDLVCNNAGVTSLGPPMWDVPLADWEWVLSVNLGGVVNGIRAFVPHLVAQNAGHVVNTASMAGLSVAPRHGPYVASKHAVVGLSEALALELATTAPDVGVTVVCPGVVSTRIHEAARNRPDGSAGAADHGALEGEELDALMAWASSISGPPVSAAESAEVVLRAVEAGRLHAAPNGSLAGVRSRVDRVLSDLEEDLAPSG
jgi:NAD(P)-dependent dehydrogenase (short-subunit alcohol dehydrogenase family)